MSALIEQGVKEEEEANGISRRSNLEDQLSSLGCQPPRNRSTNAQRSSSRPRQQPRQPPVPLQPMRKPQAPSLENRRSPPNEDSPPAYSTLFPSTSSHN